MNILVKAQTILTVLSYAADVVKAVEAISQGVPGASKKELALATIRTIYDATEPAIKFDDIYKQISTIVDALVAAYNTANIFVKSFKNAA